jgi:sugar-phosphatase
MEGTIRTSIGVAERIWAEWARRHDIDPAVLLPTIHGVRAVETIARLGLPNLDPVAAAAGITQAELESLDGVEAGPGAVAFLTALPKPNWAVVTSAPRGLVRRRMEAAGLPVLPVLVTAEDVVKGKPSPDCYLIAADRLGVTPHDCLVFEDADAGILAAEAAGASVFVITSARPADPPAQLPFAPDFTALRFVAGAVSRTYASPSHLDCV